MHAERLYAIAHQGVEVLYGESGSVAERLKSTLQRLREGGRMDPSLNPLASSIESILFQAEDSASSLRAYREKIHFDPRRLEIIESRLDEITKLKKKYGPTLEEIFASQERIDRERKSLESLGQQISELRESTEALHLEALSQARALSAKRKKIAGELGVKVEAELAGLGMKKVRFQIDVGEDPLHPLLNQNGMNQVQFLISPNPGEDLKPLAKIASGGELSRIMLALKRIFAEGTRVNTLVFDEVDAGIGGGIAEVVGRKLKEISRQHQVFCITHLAPIASFADAHYRVSKKIQGGKTAVEVDHLQGEDQVQEIARMLGGVKITEKTLAHAREMLKNTSKRG